MYQTHITSRSLCWCCATKKMISLLFVDSEEGREQAPPQSAVPLDKRETLSVYDVRSSTLPRSQLHAVLASYEKTIGLFKDFK